MSGWTKIVYVWAHMASLLHDGREKKIHNAFLQRKISIRFISPRADERMSDYQPLETDGIVLIPIAVSMALWIEKKNHLISAVP